MVDLLRLLLAVERRYRLQIREESFVLAAVLFCVAGRTLRLMRAMIFEKLAQLSGVERAASLYWFSFLDSCSPHCVRQGRALRQMRLGIAPQSSWSAVAAKTPLRLPK